MAINAAGPEDGDGLIEIPSGIGKSADDFSSQLLLKMLLGKVCRAIV
jgi:hypothetical protein